MKILLLLLCLWVLPAHSQPTSKTSPASTYVSPYTKETVFSVPLGKKKNELGLFIPGPNMESYSPMGVQGLVIGSDGSFYLNDRVNKRIQIFDTKGKWKGQIQTQSESTFFVVSKTKSVFTFSNDKMLTCFSPLGRRLWQVRANLTDFTGGLGPQMFPLSDGGVALQMWDETKGSLAIFDSKGKYQKTISGEAISPSGKVYDFEPQTKNSGLKYQASAADAIDKDLAPVFTLQPRASDSFLFVGQKFASSLGAVTVSPNDTLFSVGHVILPKKTPDFLPDYHTVYDLKVVVVVFDAQGQPQPALRFQTKTVNNMETNVCLDAQNNIYTFEYTPKTLNVVRYRLKKQP